MPFLSTRHRVSNMISMSAVPSVQFLISILLAVLWSRPSHARPEGSPFSGCASMTPSHGGIRAREDLSPYVILVSRDTYSPGDTVSVMLRGLCNIEFMGFLVQARRADPQEPRLLQRPTEAVGSFSAVLGTRYECGDNALTHDARYNGTTLLFNWTAPATPQGHVQIMSTFVQRFDSFWPQVASVVIQDPTAAPLSVNPDDLRTPFITPCQIDKPTTPAPPTEPVTTPMTTEPPPTTPTTPPPTTPAPTTPTTPTTTEILTTPVVQDQLTTPKPIFVTTPPKLTNLSEDVAIPPGWTDPPAGIVPIFEDPQCGKDRGCFLDCRGDSCDFTVMWKDIGDHVWFDVRAKQVSSNPDQYIAVAFSDDTKMGSDSVVECLEDNGQPRVNISYNARFSNEIVRDSPVFNKARVQIRDSLVHCQFARRKRQVGETRVYDLDKDWYMLVAQGAAKNGRKQEHAGLPAVSAEMVDFQTFMVVRPLVTDKIFVKTHACLMVFAWLFCASIGTVIARFYKPLWPHKTFCGRKVWFTIHRMCMITAAVLNLLAFTIIFYEVQGLSHISILRFQKLHPIIGIVTTFFVVVQIILGIFRPNSTSENRPVFNWGHWLLGIISHILTVFNMMLGVSLKKANAHPSVQYLLYTYATYQVIIVVILEIIFCNIRIKVRKQQSYSIYEIRNAIYSSTKDILDAAISEPPGAFLLRVILGIHVLVITSFTAAVIAVIVFIDVY